MWYHLISTRGKKSLNFFILLKIALSSVISRDITLFVKKKFFNSNRVISRECDNEMKTAVYRTFYFRKLTTF